MKQTITAATLTAALLFTSISTTIAVPIAQAAQSAEVQLGVNMRKSPSTSASIIRSLKKGEKVVVLQKTNSYWYEVKDSKGVKGYVSTNSKYITITGNSSSAGGGTTAPPTVTNSKAVEQVIAAGMKYIGTPYEYGSNRNTTTTFDCSDFVRQAFLDGVGLKLPADSRQQGQYVKDKGATVTKWSNLKRGDVMFFMSYKGTKQSAYAGINKSKQAVTHDGIYLGNGKILHTYSKESGGVTISNIAGTHWEYRFLYGGSAL